MDYFRKLWNGELGTVVEGDDWDQDKDCIIDENGTEYDIAEEVCDIDEFLNEHGTDNLILFRSDAYRGIGCYGGQLVVDGVRYSLDINNEYMVYRLTPLQKGV